MSSEGNFPVNDSQDKKPNTIAHFADTEGYPRTDSSHPVGDASFMQSHYPTAKTADERHQEDIDRQKMLESRLPKLFRVKIALSSSLAFACLLALSGVFEGMWKTGESGTVFQSFGLGLVVAFVAWLSISYANKVFYTFGRSPMVFWVVYGLAAFSLYALSITGLFGPLGELPSLALACGAHLALVFVLLLLLLRTGR